MPVTFDDLIPQTATDVTGGGKPSVSFDDLIPSQQTIAPPTLGANEISDAEAQEEMERNAKAPEWANRAATAVLNTAKGFVPHSLGEVPGWAANLATPATGAIDDIIKQYRIAQDVAGGMSAEEATRKHAPESFVLAEAEKTPPLSQERFQAASDIIAQMLMAAGIANGHAKAGEVPGETHAAADLSPPAPLSRTFPQDVSDNPAMARFRAVEPSAVSDALPQTPVEVPRPSESYTSPTVEPSTAEIQKPSGIKEPQPESVDVSGQNEPDKVQHGEFPQEGYTATDSPRVTEDDPFISRIANRFTQERAARGEIGEVAPGEGYATGDLVQRGLKMSPEEINQHVSDVMNGGGNDPVAQAAAIRAEEARLSDRSAQLSRISDLDPTNLAARESANSAFQDLTDFHNGPVSKLKQRFHATGMALQGEIPVDLSTSNGLREAWLKDTGKAPPPNMESVFKRTAENVRRSVADEEGVKNRLAQEIDRASANRKIPSPEEVRNRIMERMKEEPCRI